MHTKMKQHATNKQPTETRGKMVIYKNMPVFSEKGKAWALRLLALLTVMLWLNETPSNRRRKEIHGHGFGLVLCLLRCAWA
jgi:hypothetical protein